jgi:hypothetical protein
MGHNDAYTWARQKRWEGTTVRTYTVEQHDGEQEQGWLHHALIDGEDGISKHKAEHSRAEADRFRLLLAQ